MVKKTTTKEVTFGMRTVIGINTITKLSLLFSQSIPVE